MVKCSKVKTEKPHISDPGEFKEAEEVRNNLTTDTEAMKVLKGHKKYERIQQMNNSGYVAPSIVDGVDKFLDIIEKSSICL